MHSGKGTQLVLKIPSKFGTVGIFVSVTTYGTIQSSIYTNTPDAINIYL